ncbi:hypothetical protein ICM05_04385 [Leucobacter sp. cx-42]|uniref:hypothetical protein n=1 Tax=unclassified Leucobacter TaxID=2621730 RepID=UPI00165DE009|nr:MULTISPECIES: hypothetical protein [unclassified Leucobacter]MBC9953883.1 hypothetical protein [Leucobacter sp. cx-42]
MNNQNAGTEIALASQPTKGKAKRVAKVAGAATLALGLFGAVALPAYAAETTQDVAVQASAQTQALVVADFEEKALPIVTAAVPTEEIPKPVVVVPEATAAEGEAAISDAPMIPSGAGASGVVNAALAQLGQNMDCTDLVQNSLAAIGLTERRDQGGYDHGVGSFDGYGTIYPYNPLTVAAGDLLVWPGAPHIAVAVDSGSAVHGGWGDTVVFAGHQNHGANPDYIIRLG